MRRGVIGIGAVLAAALAASADEPRGAAGGQPREGYAALFAADVKSDLAVLKFNSSLGPFPTVALGRGEDLKKGSLVASLGHPYAAGYRDGSPSASWGIVSNLRRRPPG